jgi:hypothetical protein
MIATILMPTQPPDGGLAAEIAQRACFPRPSGAPVRNRANRPPLLSTIVLANRNAGSKKRGLKSAP